MEALLVEGLDRFVIIDSETKALNLADTHHPKQLPLSLQYALGLNSSAIFMGL